MSAGPTIPVPVMSPGCKRSSGTLSTGIIIRHGGDSLSQLSTAFMVRSTILTISPSQKSCVINSSRTTISGFGSQLSIANILIEISILPKEKQLEGAISTTPFSHPVMTGAILSSTINTPQHELPVESLTSV